MGHFVDRSTESLFALSGRILLSRKGCLRDDDWKLLCLQIKNVKQNQLFESLAQMTGGDAAVIAPTYDLQPEELVVLSEEALQWGESTIRVSFQCNVLKSESSAQEHLSRFYPALVSRDAVVNVGDMQIEGLDCD